MATMNYAQQLMEAKRKSKLSGRPLTSAQTSQLTKGYQSGAADRVATAGNIRTASSSMQDQMSGYAQLLAEQRAQESNMYLNALAQMASLGQGGGVDLSAYKAQLEEYNKQLDALKNYNPNVGKAESPVQDLSAYTSARFPSMVTLNPDDPKLQGNPVERVQPAGTTPSLVSSTAPDTPFMANDSPFMVVANAAQAPQDNPWYDPQATAVQNYNAYWTWRLFRDAGFGGGGSVDSAGGLSDGTGAAEGAW